MLVLQGRQVDADIPLVEQNLLSLIVALQVNFKAAIALQFHNGGSVLTKSLEG